MSDTKILWADDINDGFKSNITTWYRCMNLGDFVGKLGADNIAAVILPTEDSNNIGFILKEELTDGNSETDSENG